MGYDRSYKQSSCVCEVKTQMETVSEIISNPNKLSNEFSPNTKSTPANIIPIKCTYVLFTVDGLKSNIASYLLLIIILYFLFSIILFLKCGYKLLKMKIQNILSDKEKKDKSNKINEQKTEGTYNNNKKTKNNNRKKVKGFFPPQKTRIKFINNNNNNTKRYHRVLSSNLKTSNFSFKIDDFDNRIENDDKRNKKNKINNKNNIFYSGKRKMKNNKNSKGSKKYDFNDYDLNNMEYEKAIINDKRTCLEYYLSLLKFKHPLIFGFCPIEDYNTIVIKSCIFFLSFGIYYAVNFAFFDENMLHKIYIDKGSYNMSYFYPKICISFAISHIITIIIKFIFLSERNIHKIKIQSTYEAAYNISFNVLKYLCIKYNLFYISGIIFLFIFWLFLSSFGAVYQNTQVTLVENTIISFGISFIYPFFYNVIPCLLRICSLSNEDNQSSCLYNVSKFFQLL